LCARARDVAPAHPRKVGDREVAAFLTVLAVERKVSASTQDQALAALLFLYREVLGIPIAVGEHAAPANARCSPYGSTQTTSSWRPNQNACNFSRELDTRPTIRGYAPGGVT
jgi:hypothetical protein